MSERLYKRVKIEGQEEFLKKGPLSVQNDSSLKIGYCCIFTSSITSSIFLTFRNSRVKKIQGSLQSVEKYLPGVLTRVLKAIPRKYVYI